MGREIKDARGRIGEQAKYIYIFSLNSQGLKTLVARLYLTLSTPPPPSRPPQETLWFLLTTLGPLLPMKQKRGVKNPFESVRLFQIELLV